MVLKITTPFFILLILFLIGCRPSGDRVYIINEEDQTNGTSDSTTSYLLSVEVPETDKDFINTVIKEYTEKLKEEFVEIASEEIESVAVYELNIKTEVFQLAPNFESYKLDIYEYTGGAHGNTFYKTFTFDLRSQDLVSPYQVYQEFVPDEKTFYTKVGDVVMSKLRQQLEDKDWVEQGTGTDPKNYENFIVTDEGITFFFPPYQVASYADGSFRVLVDWMVFQ